MPWLLEDDDAVKSAADPDTNTNDVPVVKNGPSTQLEGYVYVVYALLRDSDGSNAEIGVSYVVVDGSDTDPNPVSFDYDDDDAFKTF